MATADLLKILAPEFVGLSDAQIQPFIDLAIKAHDASQWGNVYAEAMAYYAAHLLKTGGNPDDASGIDTGTAGALNAQKDGDLQRNYGAMAAGASLSKDPVTRDLSRTVYGQHYLTLRGTRAAAAPRVVQV